jgi:hypothetical protein
MPRSLVCAAPPRVLLRSILIPLLLASGAGTVEAQVSEDGVVMDGMSRTGEVVNLQALPLGPDVDVEMDGLLSEDFWDRAIPIDDFTQQVPVQGADPSQRTEIRVAYDEDAFYIGAMLFDDPDEILAYQMRRDQGLGTDDRFMWILDTFRDGRTGYFFEMNANGLMGDGIMGGGGGRFGGINKSWDGIWEGQVARLPNGWSVEVRIPFRTINFDPQSDTWGINFQRTVRRTNEEILWRGWLQNQGLFNPVFAGQVTGLQDLSQGIGLEVKPYATQGWRQVTANDDPTDYPGDIGGDLTYSITPGLRAALSYNTDFAEVEVDQRLINLTRFPLRLPEQRDFFLEGSGVYSFAPRSGPTPYFSRRIGLQSGQAIPIQYGARLGGQAGPFELGFIQVGTDAVGLGSELPTEVGIPREQFTVARVKRRLWTQSAVGAIYTRRGTSPFPGGAQLEDRHTAGVDVDLKTASFLGNKNLEFEGFFVWNSNPQPTEDRTTSELTARGFRLNFPNDRYQAHLSYREFGDHYSPAVGFVPRNNFRRVEPRIAWAPRPQSIAWLRQVEWSLQYRQLSDLKTGQLLERTWDFGLLEMNFESQDRVELQATRQYEFLDEEFDLDGIPILPGEYNVWGLNLRGNTASRRRVSLRGGVGWEEFWDGTRWSYSADVSFRPAVGYQFAVEYEHNDIDLPRGALSTNVVRFDGAWDISPWASVTSNVQWDDISDTVGLFALFRWIVKPGNEIFFVYNHNWQQFGENEDLLDRRFATLSRGATLKVNYTWRW